VRPLVLASASPARLRLLQQAGFDPAVVVSGVDEDEVARGITEPAEVVRTLAEAKAKAVIDDAAAVAKGTVVVGCDSMLRFGEQLVGKPRSPEEATARWRALRGGEGTLLTGHCVVDTSTARTAAAVASTTIRFGSPSDDEIEAYVATGEPLAVAGGFTLDGLSAPFIDGIDGDHGNVIGLSLPLFRRLLGEVGIEVTSLWV
jgi:septum formation protein